MFETATTTEMQTAFENAHKARADMLKGFWAGLFGKKTTQIPQGQTT